jgi:hypothetical protein
MKRFTASLSLASTRTLLQFAQRGLLALWIFAIPTNLFYKLAPNFGFVGGLQIDYLIPKLYVSDVVGLALVVAWVMENIASTRLQLYRKPHKAVWLFAISYTLVLVRQLFTTYPIAAVWFLLSLTLHIATILVVHQLFHSAHKKQFQRIAIVALAVSIIFQSAVGLFQFVNQRQLAGFWFFGEPQLTRDIGLSKASFADIDDALGTRLGLRILPYGTTPHPNVLAGFLVIGMLILTRHGFAVLRSRVLVISAIVMGMLTLLLTTSVSAGMTFFIGVSALTFEQVLKKMTRTVTFPRIYILDICLAICIIVPIGVHVLNVRSTHPSTSLTRRDYLNQTAVDLTADNFVYGIGMNQFTVAVALNAHDQRERVPFVQPAHHTPLLFLAENGLLGLVLVSSFCMMMRSLLSLKSFTYLVVLLPSLNLDHYLYSLTNGQLIGLLGWLLWVW